MAPYFVPTLKENKDKVVFLASPRGPDKKIRVNKKTNNSTLAICCFTMF